MVIVGLLLPIIPLVVTRFLVLRSLQLRLRLSFSFSPSFDDGLLVCLIVFRCRPSHFSISFSSFHHIYLPSFNGCAYARFMTCFISLNFFICSTNQQPRNSIIRTHFHRYRCLPLFPLLFLIFVIFSMVDDAMASLLSIIALVSRANF